jgi:hypothetical protein
VQQAMAERNAGVAADNRIELRIGIGINSGDIIRDRHDITVTASKSPPSQGACQTGRYLQGGLAHEPKWRRQLLRLH